MVERFECVGALGLEQQEECRYQVTYHTYRDGGVTIIHSKH